MYAYAWCGLVRVLVEVLEMRVTYVVGCLSGCAGHECVWCTGLLLCTCLLGVCRIGCVIVSGKNLGGCW